MHLAQKLLQLYSLTGERVLKSSYTTAHIGSGTISSLPYWKQNLLNSVKSAHASHHKHLRGDPSVPHHLDFSPIDTQQEIFFPLLQTQAYLVVQLWAAAL